LKINIIIPSFYPATVYGGPIFSSLHTSEELAKLDDMLVKVSTTNTNMYNKLDVKTNKWIKFQDNLFVKYYNETIIGKFSLQLYLNIWKDIKDADVVNIQAIFNTPVPISLFYAKLFNKPVILSPRGALCQWCIGQGNSFKKYWLKLFIKPFEKHLFWHATCDAEKEDILKWFPDADVSIVPNGVNVKMYDNYNKMNRTEYLKQYLGIDSKKCSHIVVSMSRLHAKKGFDILIKSFVKVLETDVNAMLIIAGPDEGEKDNLQKMIIDFNVQNTIFIIEPLKEQKKIDFLANADLFVLPSHNENFGNVYIESLASGTPIVASTSTPWQEVEEYDCGKWVENSVDSTHNAIVEMLKKDREDMRENAKKLAYKYDWKNIADELHKVYERILKK